MTKQEQEQFIEDLLEGFKERVLKNLAHFPEDWNGKHLREYLQQEAENAFIFSNFRDRTTTKNVKNFRLTGN